MATQKQLRDAAAERLLEATNTIVDGFTLADQLEAHQIAVNAISTFIISELTCQHHLPEPPRAA